MNDKTVFSDFEAQARNTRLYVDRINRAMYGMTFEEVIKVIGGKKEEKDGERGDRAGDQEKA